jgi:hypothetical protein
MRYVVKNITRRPVSILCNSGRSYHLPPKYEHELADIEIDNNAFIKKLYDRKVLDVTPLRDRRATDENVENVSEKKKQTDEKKKSDAKSASAKKE